jgi:hypothetical protein
MTQATEDVKIAHGFIQVIVHDENRNSGTVNLGMSTSMDVLRGTTSVSDALVGKTIEWNGYPRHGERSLVRSIKF